MNAPKTTPHKADIAELEPFEGLGMEEIFVVSSARQAGLALEELMGAKEVGFDTESKPTFHKGQKSEGPHVLQFSTLAKAFIPAPPVWTSVPSMSNNTKRTMRAASSPLWITA